MGQLTQLSGQTIAYLIFFSYLCIAFVPSPVTLKICTAKHIVRAKRDKPPPITHTNSSHCRGNTEPSSGLIAYTLRNSARMIAVAIATFRLSQVGTSGGKDGIRSEQVSKRRTSGERPLPSLPITMTPERRSGRAWGE